jgi:hypothetical protein
MARDSEEAFSALVQLLSDLSAGDPVPLCAVVSAYEQLRAGGAIPEIRAFLSSRGGRALQ